MRYIKAVVLTAAAVLLVGALARPARAEVSFDFAYSNLSQHGSWLVSAQYGHVWQPSVYNREWSPYYDGHWVFTDMGWTWVSDYQWGSIPYHYGTWVADPSIGWVWIPGNVWAPSWVVFRTGPDYIGWAPVPPGYSVGMSISVGGPSNFVFVSSRDFLSPRIRTSMIPMARTSTFINNTTVVNNISIQNNVVVNRGPDVAIVERATGHKIRQERIESVARVAPFENVSRAQLAVDPERVKHGVRVAEPVPASRPLPASDKRGTGEQRTSPAVSSKPVSDGSAASSTEPKSKGNAQPNAKAQQKAKPSAEPGAQPQQKAKPKAEPAANAQPKAKPKAEPAVNEQPKAKPSAEPGAQAQHKAKPNAEPAANAQPKAKPKAEPAANAQPKAKPKAEPAVNEQPKAKPKAEPAAQGRAERGTERQGEPKAPSRRQGQEGRPGQEGPRLRQWRRPGGDRRKRSIVNRRCPSLSPPRPPAMDSAPCLPLVRALTGTDVAGLSIQAIETGGFDETEDDSCRHPDRPGHRGVAYQGITYDQREESSIWARCMSRQRRPTPSRCLRSSGRSRSSAGSSLLVIGGKRLSHAA